MTTLSSSHSSRLDYVPYRLTLSDLPDIMSLQQEVYDALVDKNAILRRSEGKFAQSLQAPHIVVGLFHGALPVQVDNMATVHREGGVLAAMAVARFSEDVKRPEAEVQSVYVSPHHKVPGGLMPFLLDEIEAACAQKDKAVRLHCRVAEGNKSAQKFLDAGYRYIGHTHRPVDVDPDGTKVELYEKHLPALVGNLVVLQPTPTAVEIRLSRPQVQARLQHR